MSRKVVLFDIDGTLLRSHGAGVRAMRRAACRVLGERCEGARIDFGGAMDPWIFAQLAAHGGYTIDDAIHSEFRRVYREHLIEELASAEKKSEALPGVHALLSHLRSAELATIGVLTGNYSDTGVLKLRAVDIDPEQFEIAAWGEMARERPLLVPVALGQLGRSVPPGDVIIVGDTVRDVWCAQKNGAVCIAVATGGSTADELRAAGADVVLSTLTEAEALLERLV